VFCAALLLLSAAGAAETPTPEQRQLLNELLDVIHVDQLWPQMMDIAFRTVQETMTPQEFERFRTLFASKVDGPAVIRDIYGKIYFKYYTEDDLRALIAFYKTPVGQKMLATMPKLTSDAIDEAQKTLAPQMMAIFDVIEQEREQRRHTLRDMHDIAIALDAWKLSDGTGYPEAKDMAGLAETLKIVSTHIKVNDVWGHPYAYSLSDDRQHYRLVSAGADGANDIVMEDGKFTQLPKDWPPPK